MENIEFKTELKKLKCTAHNKHPSINLSGYKASAKVCCEDFGVTVVDKVFELKADITDVRLKKKLTTFLTISRQYLD